MSVGTIENGKYVTDGEWKSSDGFNWTYAYPTRSLVGTSTSTNHKQYSLTLPKLDKGLYMVTFMGGSGDTNQGYVGDASWGSDVYNYSVGQANEKIWWYPALEKGKKSILAPGYRRCEWCNFNWDGLFEVLEDGVDDAVITVEIGLYQFTGTRYYNLTVQLVKIAR